VNLRRTGVLLGIVSAIGVLLVVMAATERKSPGRVSSVHGRIAELDGGESCSKCHGGWFGDMRSACSECHGDIATQLTERRGLHGTLAVEVASNCSNCHGEHHGDEFQLVNRLAFAQAGVPDHKRFDHARIGFVMAGRHLELECRECHLHADATLLPEGQKRYLGLQQQCASCHADPHGGRMQFDCTTCHGQHTFAEPGLADHDRWLPLHGAHAAVGCRQCHAESTAHALEALRPGAAERGRQCADCHQAPHAPAFLLGNAAAAAQTPTGVCVVCHALDLPKFTDPGVTVTPAQHAHGGFPLQAPHDDVACADCHRPGTTWTERHPGRAPQQCRSCHGDPHHGQFDSGPFAADGCVACHAATHFAPHEFDRDHHARAALPLDGAHAQLECKQCHADPAPDVPRTFRGTPSRCEQCHDDVHGDAFAAHGERLRAAPRGSCALCHGTEAFAALDHARFDHADWTGFRIDGAHAQIECTDCHARTSAPDPLGRRFGRIPEHGAGVASCATCHGDPHAGAFDRGALPTAIDGRSGCVRCHDTASFRALPHGFDHGAATGYVLAGRHAELDCTSCHERLPTADAAGRTWRQAAGRDCADCHRDPHQRQFERLGQTDCNRCHKSTTTFATLSFRHNLDSRFQLGDQHSKVPCASCHKPESIEGKTVTRFKPLPVECVDCHGREEGGAAFRRRRQ
jgi:hypothetical protein